MNKNRIVILDYGYGNIFSIKNAVKSCGYDAFVSNSKDDIFEATHLIIPGVGAFKNGLSGLYDNNLQKHLLEFSKLEKPILGICLGMQLLSTISYEFGKNKGLNILSGIVKPLPKNSKNNNDLTKVPNIGWVKLNIIDKKNNILSGLGKKDEVYLVHSYFLEPKNENNILATCNYYGHQICIAVKKDNVYGTQFHPEKSGPTGLKILKKFCELKTQTDEV